MKFTDGNWMVREGVHPCYPAQAYEVHADDDSVTVIAPTRKIRHRGDTMDGPILAVRFTSPMPDVIAVRLSHFTGAKERGPSFQLNTERPSVKIEASDHEATLTSGELSVKVGGLDNWAVDFTANGRSITSSGLKGMGYARVDGIGGFVHEQLDLAVGECVYGLGERFTAFVKNGQVVDIWNKDGGTGSEQAYKSIPFYMTNRGYGVFVDHPGEVSFEVATEKVTRVQFSVPGESMEYFVIYGPTPREVIEKYTRLTGRPARPPAWSFGLWLTTSFTTSYSEETVNSFIQGMEDRNLPLRVFHLDCFWMREFRWCDFRWDERLFADPSALIARLKKRGLRVSIWINPYLGQLSEVFDEARDAGYLLKRPNGDVWQTEQWQAGMGIVDFTNPEAREWYADKLRGLVDMGIDSFKTDFGERIPLDVVYHDGSDPAKMHNYYTYLYNETVFNVLREKLGENEACVFARSATVGGQKFPIHWGGDSWSTFESMAESLRGGLSLGLCGFGFWSHDIGGFEGTPPTEVYKRWLAFGMLSTHSRLHGSSSYRVPWLFDEEAVDVLRFFTQLKCRLMPYLYAQAITASQTGTPMMRAMMIEFPSDPGCDYVDRQYLLGDSLLVAPVFSASGEVDFYVPAGHWTSFLSGRVVQGPGWFKETHDFLSLPLLARPNSVIPVGSDNSKPDYDYSHGVTLRIYEIADGATIKTEIPSTTGETASTFTTERRGVHIFIQAEGTATEWQVLLSGQTSVASTVDASAVEANLGTLITPKSNSKRISVELVEEGSPGD